MIRNLKSGDLQKIKVIGNREIAIKKAVNFGDLKTSHDLCVLEARKSSLVYVDKHYDLIITSSAGYPLDKTYYQTIYSQGKVTDKNWSLFNIKIYYKQNVQNTTIYVNCFGSPHLERNRAFAFRS